MRSKPCMASDIDTANPDRGLGFGLLNWLPGSRLGRLIIVLNMLGLAIVIGGALVLNELRQGLVNARMDSLTTQGELITTIIDQAATVGEPVPAMDAGYASQILQLLSNPKTQRARLFDKDGRLIADSDWVVDRVDSKALPAAKPKASGRSGDAASQTGPKASIAARVAKSLRDEVSRALSGQHVSDTRRSEDGRLVVSVSMPIQHVQAILGVLTLEANDVDQIIARQRAALVPFILLSMIVTAASSLVLNTLIARPVRRLARAADTVRLSRARSITLPDIAKRDDELGDLTRALQAMTDAQSERMDAIERFAADVAHEIKNPLTSMRSAVETLDLVRDGPPRDKLLGIIKQDVQRLDRLVTDISNASRLDAELSREDARPIDLGRLLTDIVQTYQDSLRAGEARPVVTISDGQDVVTVLGTEGSLGQVFRNLIDNAKSFSPLGGEVRLALDTVRGEAVVTVEDDGPGIPPDNLETIFQRFYTSRPKGSAFGGNSGLGLSIARQIIESQGGTLCATNRQDQAGVVSGARFTVRIPLARR